MAWFVWKLKIGHKIKFVAIAWQVLIYNLLFLATLIYTLGYFVYYHESIPVFKILSGDFLAVAATLRSDLTHGFEGGSIFSYYRPITKDLFFFIAFVLIVYYRKKIVFKILACLSISFVLLAHLEKAYSINIFLALAMLRIIEDKTIKFSKEIYILITLIFIAVLVTYLFFASSFVDAIEYIPYRLMAQIGYVTEQLQISKQYEPLLFQGLNMGSLGRLLEIDYIDISKLAFESVHPDLVALGISGSSAGLAIVDAYMIFGVLGIPFLAIIMALQFYFDKLIRISIFSSNLTGFSFAILMSFYIYFICFYPLFLIGSFLGMFSIPYLFQQGLLLCVLSILLLFKVTFVRCN
jgi:hypothetical protein